MLKEKALSYFLEQDYNCAESTLHALNDEYKLGLTKEDIKLVSGFGGGCGCGIVCGALAGGIAALGRLTVPERAHATPGFKESCGEYCAAFAAKLGSTECRELKPRYFREDVRCAAVIEAAAECFEAFTAEKGIG